MLQDLGETRCYITLSCRAYSGADPQALLTGPPAGTNPQRLWSTLRFSLESLLLTHDTARLQSQALNLESVSDYSCILK